MSEIEDIKKKLDEHEKRISKLEEFLPKTPIVKTKKISIKEFILSKKPKNDTDKTLTIGYFLEKHEGVTPFNVKDIENGFRNAREPLPKNLSDKIQMNAKKGFIMLAKERKDKLLSWVLTNSGEKYVENGFKK